MNVLCKNQFMSFKRHDKLAVIGSGYSINDVSIEKLVKIDIGYDTIGMNWSCKLHRPMTWYIVREQAASPKRIGRLQTLSDFLHDINRTQTTLIIKDMSYREGNYIHAQHTDKFTHDGMIFKEIPGKCKAAAFGDDIFEDGIHHGKATMWDVLHFAVGMKYREILFIGVDLYDSRYFWLPYDEASPMVQAEGRSCNDPHLAAENTIRIVCDTRDTFGIEMYVENPKSLLAKHIEVWK